MKYILFWMALVSSVTARSQTVTELNSQILKFYQTKEYARAIPLAIRAMEMAKKEYSDTDKMYITTVESLALLYARTNQPHNALPLYKRVASAEKIVSGPKSERYAFVLTGLAITYSDLEMYSEAVELEVEIAEITKGIFGENSPEYVESLTYLAQTYSNMEEFAKAEKLFITITDIGKKIQGGNSMQYSNILNGFAIFYYNLGQYEKAEPLYLKAKEIRKKIDGENSAAYSAVLNNLGVLYSHSGYWKKAEETYRQSISIDKQNKQDNTPGYANNLNNLAIVYSRSNRYAEAEPLLLEAKAIRKTAFGENHPKYAASLNDLGALYLRMGQYEKAEPFLTEAAEKWKGFADERPTDYANSLDNLATLYASWGKTEKAEPFLLKSSAIRVNNVKRNFTIFSEKEKENYLANNMVLVEKCNSLLYNSNNPSPALLLNNLNLQIFIKSLSLLYKKALLNAILNSGDEGTRSLFNRWQANRKLLGKQYALPASRRIPQLDSIEAESQSLEKELTRKSAAFRQQEDAINISMVEVQKEMKQDEVCIEFVSFRLVKKTWTDSIMYAAYIFNKKSTVPVFVPLFEERQLQKLLDSAGATTVNKVNSFYRGTKMENNASGKALGKELYNLVWAPLEPYLKGAKQISYSPAGKLYGIAFHALSPDSTVLLMDKYQLQQYTSTRQVALRNTEKQADRLANITLFGNASFTMDSLSLVKQKTSLAKNKSTAIYSPQNRSIDNNTWNSLPGTEQEVNKIKQLFENNKSNTKIFVQTKASEENLKSLSGNSPQILHIATHGFFLPEPDKKAGESSLNNNNAYTLADDPLLRTGLILAGGNYAWSGKPSIEGVEDGIATAYEISQLDLSHTDLVVLSACETALGDVKGSEGVFGLQRAFKMAGVKKMIVSLWQVPDKETAELMTAFYSYGMKGKTMNEAFALAQADMRKKYPPFYWAAFVLIE